MPAEAETLPRLEGFTAVGGASEAGVVVETFTAEKGDEVAGGSVGAMPLAAAAVVVVAVDFEISSDAFRDRCPARKHRAPNSPHASAVLTLIRAIFFDTQSAISTSLRTRVL